MRDQAEKLRQLAGCGGAECSQDRLHGGGRVLAITSGKGGVGKTNLAANLGAVLAERGNTVTVLDADFGLANLDILLNLNPRRNLRDVVNGEADVSEVVVEVSPSFRVIPGASGVAVLADLDEVQRANLLRSVAPLTRDQDFVLIDTAAGIGRNVIDVCLAAGEVLLVTNPEPTSLTDAYGLVKLLFSRRAEVAVSLVVNSVENSQEGRAVHSKLDQVMNRFLGEGIAYLGHIVRDDCVGHAALRQTPFVTAYPRSAASRCLGTLASALVGGQSRSAGGAVGFWQRLLQVGHGQRTQGALGPA